LAPTLEPLYRRVIETGEPIAHSESTDELGLRSGDRRHWLSSYYPVRTADGEVTGVGAVIMDVTAQRRADDRLRLLARAGELFASSLDADDVFARILEVVVPGIADSLHIFIADGASLRRVACAHVDPQLLPVLESLPSVYPLGQDSPMFMATVFEHGEPVVFDDVSTEVYERLVEYGANREAMDRIGSRSMMLVPLVARGESLGVMAIGSREPGRYTGEYLALALELAGRAAVTIDNARLFHEASFRRTLLEAQQEASIDGLLLVSPTGELLSYNRRFAEIWRMPEDVVASGSDETALANAVQWVLEPDVFLARVHDAYERREPTRDELALVDGRTLERHGTPVRDEGGAYHGYLWSFRDVTDARRAERALRDAQATLEAAATAARVGTWYWDVAANTAFADEFISSAFGVDPAVGAVGVSGDVWFAAINDQDRPRVEAALAGAIAAGGDYEEEFRVRGLDDAERWVLWRGVVETDAAGCGSRILGAVADITERKRDERELERRAQVSQALEFVADGVFLLDRSGVVRLWNPAAAAIIGLEEAVVVGASLAETVPGWTHLERLVPVAALDGRSGLRAETLPLDVGGRELWLSISGVDFQEGIVYAFRDVTEERDVDRLKSDFVSTVSHELRTPLAAIYGAAMTLRREDVPLNPAQRDGMLAVVSGEAERLARIVNDILLASRLDSDVVDVAIGRADAAELTRTVIAAAEAHLPPGIELTLSAPDDLPPIAADPDKLRQVLVNLVENAVKYSPDGGPVEVALAVRSSQMRFSVADAGLGIPASEHARIFEKFYRLDPNLTRGVGGTGLGLYICREIVRRMNGRIWLESLPGRGSTFFVEVPLA
ncbi:MAG: PAS domain-containing protein, partial [Actinobacteria bacterium]|nr:PAS domain-containing protein [Actinomycetota bacterium]